MRVRRPKRLVLIEPLDIAEYKDVLPMPAILAASATLTANGKWFIFNLLSSPESVWRLVVEHSHNRKIRQRFDGCNSVSI